MSEIERDRHDYNVSQFSMKRANYGLTDEITKRCNACVSGQIALGTGIRLCEVHKSFITCGGTCDLHELDEKYSSLKKRIESEEKDEETIPFVKPFDGTDLSQGDER